MRDFLEYEVDMSDDMTEIRRYENYEYADLIRDSPFAQHEQDYFQSLVDAVHEIGIPFRKRKENKEKIDWKKTGF